MTSDQTTVSGQPARETQVTAEALVTARVESPVVREEPVREPVPELQENMAEMTIDQILKINTNSIDFGDVYPGQIVEETVIILNNLVNTKVPFRIKVNCLTKEFDELDEYVYSMRRPSPNEVFNYNDTFLILLAQKAVSYYKLAIKVPSMNCEKEILGNIEITSNECKDSIITIPIRSRIVLPSIKCEKMIHIKSLKMSVVKLFLKTLNKHDFRISLKNMAKTACTVELSVLRNEPKTNFLEFAFFPPQLTLNPALSTNFLMTVKCTNMEVSTEIKEARCVLLVKVKNAVCVFAFPIVIILGDGSAASGPVVS